MNAARDFAMRYIAISSRRAREGAFLPHRNNALASQMIYG